MRTFIEQKNITNGQTLSQRRFGNKKVIPAGSQKTFQVIEGFFNVINPHFDFLYSKININYTP